MFFGCTNLEYLDVSNWNTARVIHTGTMLEYTSSLHIVNLGKAWFRSPEMRLPYAAPNFNADSLWQLQNVPNPKTMSWQELANSADTDFQPGIYKRVQA
ncbi:hypothetical protein D2E26_1293 [Bifidobacterium dolichotidis]|uniref:Uncharacterized protein n=1 Tax=Bifidobacterium dolichotidis TaxID=2306976 RepID=A0A430FQX3_9BIFI|nr:hypothetical protein D2E26_1293 [Bifidobacterium dolichotidis]